MEGCLLDPLLFKPYCLRRGGATHHFCEHGDLRLTQHKGRWASYKACKLYVVEGQRELNDNVLDDATRVQLEAYATVLKRF